MSDNQFLKFACGAPGDAPTARTPPPRQRKRPRASSDDDDAAADPPKGVPARLGDGHPLRCIVVGHNPSAEAWRQGHYYAHKSNRMWPILKETGIAPPHIRGAVDDELMPADAGVGFVDVGTGHPGTDSRKFDVRDFAAWSGVFYGRLRDHAAAAQAWMERERGCACGRCGAPCVVAFSGKRQFVELYNATRPPGTKQLNGATVPLGENLSRSLLPGGWPLTSDTEVWVMTSTSGASALGNEARITPWRKLAARLDEQPWPRVARCKDGARAAE
ncbi:unnamed protein product [Pedinophyceae sp. YPF-701]|nr:unnamed protein product [Pedinophyceae sp. YPF-701]